MKKKKILHIVEAFGGGIFSFLMQHSSKLKKIYWLIEKIGTSGRIGYQKT